MRLKYMAVCVASVWTLAPVAAAEKPRPDDGEVKQRLVGAWTTCVGGGAESQADGTIRYAEGGTFVAEGSVKLGGDDTADVRVEGTWQVEDGVVTLKVTKTTHPGLAPVGGEMRETVIAIDDKVLRFKRGIGREKERKRLAE